LGSAVTTIGLGWFGAHIAARFSWRLRTAIFSRVEAFSMEELNGFSTASLITRSTNDITQIQMFVVMCIQMLLRAPIMAVWALGKISVSSWKWTTLTGGAVVILVIMIASVMSYALPRFRKIQTLTDNLNRVARGKPDWHSCRPGLQRRKIPGRKV
jgi:ATP-binding cassette subfamily B protein